MIEYRTGNLLGAEAEALVNTVNCVGVMGKGIALQFAKKFPEMLSSYKQACKDKELKPGTIHVYELDDLLLPRLILNFPTKRHWKARSRMEDIASGLDALVRVIQERNIKSIAIPPLGCGNGGLEWAAVSSLIQEKLESLEDVNILVFPPARTPDAKQMSHNTDRPAMNPSRAICVKLWQQYFALGYELSLLEVHKLLYFLQEAGEPLKLRFTKQTYGPYADNLRHLLHRFEGHFTIGFADGQNKPDTPIELLPGAIEEADEFLEASAKQSVRSLNRLNRVAKLIEGFESPYGMELLATVHWVATVEGATTPLDALAAVKAWNSRKRKLMEPKHVKLAWKCLNEGGWINEAKTA